MKQHPRCPTCGRKAPGRDRLAVPAGALKLYRAGQTAREVGKALGVSLHTVLKRLHEAGEPVRRQGASRLDSHHETIRARRAAGETLLSIGTAYAVSRERIRQICSQKENAK